MYMNIVSLIGRIRLLNLLMKMRIVVGVVLIERYMIRDMMMKVMVVSCSD